MNRLIMNCLLIATFMVPASGGYWAITETEKAYIVEFRTGEMRHQPQTRTDLDERHPTRQKTEKGGHYREEDEATAGSSTAPEKAGVMAQHD